MTLRRVIFVSVFSLATALPLSAAFAPKFSLNSLAPFMGKAGKQVGGVIENLQDVLATVFSKVKGDDFNQKMTYVSTEIMCIKGPTKHKFETARAIVDLAKKAEEKNRSGDLERKLAAAKKYWSSVIRPLAGWDGILNTGDSAALLSCVKQSQIDEAADYLIRYGQQQVENRASAYPQGPFFVGRIVRRKKAEGKAQVRNMYWRNPDQFRQEVESQGREIANKALTDIFGLKEPGFQEPLCEEGKERPGNREFDLIAAIAFVNEATGFDIWDLARQAIKNEVYERPQPELDFNQYIPNSIANEELGVQFEFPKGLPLRDLEDALMHDSLPTNLIISMKEEDRIVKGKKQKMKIFEIEPQNLGLGINLHLYKYQKPDGTWVSYPTVSNVLPDSPAAKMGLKKGDYIKTLNGEDMGDKGSEYAKRAIEMVARHRNRNVEITARRLKDDGQTREDVVLEGEMAHPCPGSQILPDDKEMAMEMSRALKEKAATH